MKKLLTIILFLTPLSALAAPAVSFVPSLVPITNNTYYLGTTSPSTLQWLGIFTKALQIGDLSGSGTRCVQVDNNGLLAKATSACGAGGGGGSGGGTFSTTTSTVAGQLINYPNNSTDIVVIGDSATTSGPIYFDPNLVRVKLFNQFFSLSSTTLQNFTFVNGTGTSATTTNFFATTASSSNLFAAKISGAGLGSCSGASNALTYNSASSIFGCNSITSVSGNAGTATALATGRTLSISGDLTYTSPSFDGTGNVTAAGTLATVNSNVGTFGGTNSIPTFTVNGKGLITAASANTPSIPASEITTGTFGTGDYTFPANLTITGNATSTTMFATTASSTNLFVNQPNGCVQITAGKLLSTGSNCGSGSGAVSSVSDDGTGTLTISPTTGAVLAAINLGHANTWTGGQTFTNATSTTFSTTKASTTSLWIDGVKSAILLTNASGAVSGYAGASACSSNNFVTTISALGATTCGSSTISGVALGSNLFAHTHDSTLSGTSFNGSAAVSDWGINLGNANTWTAGQMILASSTIGDGTAAGGLTINGTATTTGLKISATGALVIPNATTPTIDVNHDLGINTTAASSSLRFFDGSATRVLYPTFDKPTIYASSSLAYDGAYGASGTTTYVIWNPSHAMTLSSLYCKTNVGTVWYEVGNGTASTTIQCTTSGAVSNNSVTFTLRQNVMEALGREATNPDRITVTPTFQYSAD